MNELCLAKLIPEDAVVKSAEYEPRFHPEAHDAWATYQRAQLQGSFGPGTRWILDKNWMGGEIFHEILASRAKFLE